MYKYHIRVRGNVKTRLDESMTDGAEDGTSLKGEDVHTPPPRMIYVIEHMETSLSRWVACEYTRMIRDCGAARLLFTNMKPGVNCPAYDEESMQFLKGAKLVPETFEEYARGHPKRRTCLLDEKAPEGILRPSDVTKFDYFLFGGVLGNVDDLDMDRTSELRVHGYASRHLGPDQMSTPTALDVSFRVLDGQQEISAMRFINRPEFAINDCETLQIPFKYLVDDDGNAIIADGILDILTEDLEWDLDSLM